MTVKIKDFGTITADRKTLNHLTIVFDAAAERNQLKHHHETAKLYRSAAETIYNTLDQVRFYED